MGLTIKDAIKQGHQASYSGLRRSATDTLDMANKHKAVLLQVLLTCASSPLAKVTNEQEAKKSVLFLFRKFYVLKGPFCQKKRMNEKVIALRS